MSQVKRKIARAAIVVACVGTALFAIAVPPAIARHAATHTFSSSFKSPLGIPAGERGLDGIAVDEETGYLYLENVAAGIPLEKYSATGTPVAFTAPEANASNTLLTPGGGGFRAGTVEVDNSGNPATKGRIYVTAESGIDAFEPSGERLGGNFPLEVQARDVAIEPGTGNLWILFFGGRVTEYSPDGVLLGKFFEAPGNSARIAVDGHGNFYLAQFSTVYRYNLQSEQLTQFGLGSDVAVDPATEDVYTYFGGSTVRQYGIGGALLFEFGQAPESNNGIPTVAVNGATGTVYRGIGGTIEIYSPGPAVILPDATTDPATAFAASSATVHGTVNPDGEPTEECYFEWGTTTSYSQKVTCEEGAVLTGSTPMDVSVQLSELEKGTTYHYRVVAVNPNGTISGLDRTFSPSSSPTFSDEHVGDVHSDSVVLHGAINPEGAPTSYQFEYGLEDCASSPCTALPLGQLPLGVAPVDRSVKVTGLEAGTTYHYRVAGENQTGSATGEDHTFTTFPITRVLEDSCANAHVRQQTGAALLLDCRAYELVSAANAGGYDVESTLVPGQEPFDGYPEVGPESRVLYAVHDGAIPGAGNPANHGPDTYIAARGSKGWTTKYVGIPSDNPYSGQSFASSLLEADPGLDTFAYGGEGICDPCFGDGSTNIPLRIPDGSLIQGIAGSQGAVANPAGHVGRYLSADGGHLVFGTTTKLEPAGNENGDVTVYIRDLRAAGTEVVSTLPSGETMTGPGIGELDVSRNGSRVVVGQELSTDSDDNEYWHLYMHIAGSSHSVDLTPGATDGVEYAGMTDDGTRVFYSTRDRLLPSDTDNSADIYEAEVDGSGTMDLELVTASASGPSNSDECDPPGEWNTVEGGPDCGAVPFAGGAGVAAEAGTFYFLSPERLDLSNPANMPVQDDPNLYVVKPGDLPHYVATLDAGTGAIDNPAIAHAVSQSATHTYGDFQVTRDGRYAAFASDRPLTGFDNGGYLEVFRYDADDGSILCASCNPTNARAVGGSTLPQNGLGLAEDGSVFFDSADAIAPRDLDERVDAYEYEDGAVQLISTGVSPFDSRLLGIDANGTNAYFFTRDSLVSQDENGDLVKIYDARAQGGFAYIPPAVPCKASDECHGPGSEAPPAPKIPTIRGSSGNETGSVTRQACGRHRVRRHGRCMKARRHSHHKRRSRKGRKRHGSPREGRGASRR